MSIKVKTAVTVVQFGGQWVGVQITGSEKTFITSFNSDKKTAAAAAKQYALVNKFEYKKSGAGFNPIISTCKERDDYYIITIFKEYIRIANDSKTNDKNLAESKAREFAAKHQLEYAQLTKGYTLLSNGEFVKDC